MSEVMNYDPNLVLSGRMAKQVDPALARAVVAEMVGEAKR